MADNTKYALADALRRQLQKKPLNKITISDITDECGVNRMTFYYHFHDIYDLIDWAFREEVEQATKDKHYAPSEWRTNILDVCQVILNNKSFIMNIYRSVGREKVEQYLYKGLYPTVSSLINEQLQGVNVPEDGRKLYANFYVYGISGIIQNWVNYDMKEDPASLVDRMAILVRGNLDSVIEAYSQKS